ncbi:MAG TPA: HepT-like ribonuclease domain-containing protein [Bradyrhizobium sp.]|nr:HepT-like ribonuclease domain-containing protein [Bradyrhizobium sp.]
MPSEKESGALRDMLRHIDLAEQFAHGHSYESLRDDLQALYAVILSLEIISEASRRLSDELKARHAGIPWREMAAAGNFYRHNYEDVTARRVWKTLVEDLPPLRAALDQELKRRR